MEHRTNSYYAELYASELDHVRAGWRYPLEQALRFAVAVELAQRLGPLGRVLDAGCGPGGLLEYMRREQIAFEDYTGADLLPEAVALGMERACERSRFVCADIRQRSFQGDVAFAIGAAVDGARAGDRVAQVWSLIEPLANAMSRGGVLIVLDRRWLEQQGVLGMERALFGVSEEELDAISRRLERSGLECVIQRGFLESDAALCWSRCGFEPASSSERWGVHERLLRTPWASQFDRYWHARLWFDAGAYERALEALEESTLGARAEVLRARIEAVS